MDSKIIQIQAVNVHASVNWGEHVQVFALCDDGSLWVRYEMVSYSNMPDDGKWHLVSESVKS